jgi:hypothetical protein
MATETDPIDPGVLAGPVNVYSTLRDAPAPEFPCQILGRRDRRAPDFAPHLEGFQGFIMRNGAMTPRRWRLLQHIGRAQTQYSLLLEPEQLAALRVWAGRVNAVLFLADSSVRAPAGGLLWSPDAPDAPDGDPAAEVPVPSDALARKQRSLDALAARNLASPASLPPVISEAEVAFRTPREAALRFLALVAVAVRGESLANGPELPIETLRKRLPLAFEAFSPTEAEFMRGKTFFRSAPRPASQAIADAVWRYESAAALWWALDAGADLSFPAAIRDPAHLVGRAMDLDPATFVAGARLRPAAEILDQLDLMYRLNWILADNRANGRPEPAGIVAGVVAERHYALNWLTRFQDADWDEVQTPT